MLTSIRSQILVGFLLPCLIIAGIGIYSELQIRTDEQIVRDLYDNPLMAINLSRSANFAFSQMNNQILAERLGADPSVAERRINEITADFFDDLDVASERVLSAKARALIAEIVADARRWDGLRRERAFAGQAASPAPALDTLASSIFAKFDSLGEYVLQDGFEKREAASQAIQRQRLVGAAAASVGLLFSLTVALLLSRRILMPLSAAASIANRVAGGDFQAPIPVGGRDETGILLRSMAVMQRNIQEMMEREAARRRSAQMRLVDAVEGSLEGTMLLDSEGRIVVVNRQVRAFFPSIADLLQPNADFAAVFGAAGERPPDIDGGRIWLDRVRTSGELRLAGGRWLRISESETRDGGMFLFLSDITLVKEREDSLQAARQAAEAASVAKTNFLANMGHELRTPLNAVIGFSDIIAQEQFGPVGTPQYREYAEDIAASGRHLLGIINDVLDLAKSADGKLRLANDKVDLRDVVGDCARLVAGQCAAGGLSLDVAHRPTPVVVRGDEMKLRQILLNLLSNAIKFSPAGEPVTVSLLSRPPDRVGFAVADRGIGIRPEDVATALEPFGQVDSNLARRYDGTGLGLPLAKALTELHGGQLDVVSVLGQGTTVTVWLPASV